MIKTMLRQVGKYAKASIMTPVLSCLEVLMEVLIPFVTASLIDKGIQAGNLGEISKYAIIMLGLSLLSLFFGVAAARVAAYSGAGFASNLRNAMYRNIQTFSFSNIDKYSTAGLITRMTTDVNNIQNAYQMLMRMAVRAPLTMILSMIMCFAINGQLSLIFLAALLVLSGALFLIIRHVSKCFSAAFKKYDELNGSVQENVSAIRVVKAFVREDYESTRFSKVAKKLYDLFIKAESIIALNNPVMMLTIYGCMIALCWIGAHFVVGGTLTTGELTSMFSYVISILSSLMMVSMVFVMITMSMASIRRVCEVLEEKADITNPENPVATVKDGSIDFDKVDFTYSKEGSGEDILDDIDLHIASGETVGIIGGTGCGKSSLVNLISRLYDVKRGTVKVGGVDVRRYDLEVLRNEVAVVLQKNVLFSGTILDNLRWGKEDATLEECQEACRQACADEFINRLPDGYNSKVEQGGANFSGGQKQRLCIARALMKKPKVLILDDSTSAVDTATDAHIRKAFAEAIPGTTKLIIAQRISSVKDADRIIVMDDGKVVAFDTHEKLLETCDIYREIYDCQTQGGGDFDEPHNAAPAEGGAAL